MIKKLKNYILCGNLELAAMTAERIKNLEGEKIYDNILYGLIFEIAEEKENISIYIFFLKLIMAHEKSFLHTLAGFVWQYSFPFFSGAYNLTYAHLKSIANLEHDSLNSLEGILSIWTLPGETISPNEAKNIALKIACGVHISITVLFHTCNINCGTVSNKNSEKMLY